MPDPISDPNAPVTSPVVALPLVGDVVPSDECVGCDAVDAVPNEFGELAFTASASCSDVDVISFDGITYDIRMHMQGDDGEMGFVDWQYDASLETMNMVDASENVDPADAFGEFAAKSKKPGSKDGRTGGKGSCGKLTQAQLYIKLTDGTEFWPKDHADFIRIINAIRSQGRTVATMIIKGHGGAGGVQVGPGAWLTCLNGTIEITPEAGTATEIQDILDDITNGNTVISLRACHSRGLADCIESHLNCDCRGACRFVIGIPGTTIGIGVYR